MSILMIWATTLSPVTIIMGQLVVLKSAGARSRIQERLAAELKGEIKNGRTI